MLFKKFKILLTILIFSHTSIALISTLNKKNIVLSMESCHLPNSNQPEINTEEDCSLFNSNQPEINTEEDCSSSNSNQPEINTEEDCSSSNSNQPEISALAQKYMNYVVEYFKQLQNLELNPKNKKDYIINYIIKSIKYFLIQYLQITKSENYLILIDEIESNKITISRLIEILKEKFKEVVSRKISLKETLSCNVYPTVHLSFPFLFSIVKTAEPSGDLITFSLNFLKHNLIDFIPKIKNNLNNNFVIYLIDAFDDSIVCQSTGYFSEHEFFAREIVTKPVLIEKNKIKSYKPYKIVLENNKNGKEIFRTDDFIIEFENLNFNRKIYLEKCVNEFFNLSSDKKIYLEKYVNEFFKI